MKIQHVFCTEQHRSAITPVVHELLSRGHDVVEVKVKGGDVNTRRSGYENVDVEGSVATLCAYPHIIENANGRYEKFYGKKICIEHGVNPVAWAFPLERHCLFDHVFLAGQWQEDAICRSGMMGAMEGKYRVTGWPKADALVPFAENPELRLPKKAALIQKLKLDPDKPIISFVPTHGGAWHRVDEIRRLGIPNLVIAPHEGRYAQFRGADHERGKLEINYAEEYLHYIETGNIYEVLLASDVIIGDYSSANLEALVLDIPVIQILADVQLHNRKENPMELGYYPLSIKDRREFRIGANVKDISRELEGEIVSALHKPDGYWTQEREFWKTEIFSNLGTATKVCCDTIEELCQN